MENDDEQNITYQYAAERILDKLRTTFGDQFKEYFFWRSVCYTC
jgi:hypothetical protein